MHAFGIFSLGIESNQHNLTMPPRRLHKRPISATPYFNRVKNNKVEVEATNRSVPGDHFYIDDDGNMQPLEIGSIPNMQTFADSSVRSSGRLAHPNRDKYCWVCHVDGTTEFCDTCIRSFHIQCLRRTIEKILPENWRCPQCKELRNAKNDFQRRQVDLVKFNELLKFILDRLYIDEELKKFDTSFNNVLRSVPDIVIINPIDLNLIEEKVTDSKYESTMEFIVDIKWIIHNCGIAFKEIKSIFPKAKRMLRFCERELYDIEICPECYLGSNTYPDSRWFVNACERPHLLVWAKIKGNREPYWPAKAVAWKNGYVDVRFFGDHSCAFVPSASVFLYSKENPNKRMNAMSQKQLDDYTKEVYKYIANLEKKFSLFKFMPPMRKFEPEKIYIHLHEMLPYLYIEENYEYFRKMRDFINRDAKQPVKLSLGYSPEVASVGLKRLSVVVIPLEHDLVRHNQQDNNAADVNALAQSIANKMNIKTEAIKSFEMIVDPDSPQGTVMIFSSDSENDEDESEVTMIEVGSVVTNQVQQVSMDNESPSSRAGEQSQSNTTVRMLSTPRNDKRTQSAQIINEQFEDPANNSLNRSMPVIDGTNEFETHEEDGIAPESGPSALNGSLSNAVTTDMDVIDNEVWRQVKQILDIRMKKAHRLEQQHYQETLNANKMKMKKLEEENKVLKKENEHWKASLREKDADFKKQLNEINRNCMKQLDKNEESMKRERERHEIEFKAKIEAAKIEWRNKKWCAFALCDQEVETSAASSEFCSFPCMRQSWLQSAVNVNQTNNNQDEINMDEIH